MLVVGKTIDYRDQVVWGFKCTSEWRHAVALLSTKQLKERQHDSIGRPHNLAELGPKLIDSGHVKVNFNWTCRQIRLAVVGK